MKQTNIPIKFSAHFMLTTYCNAYCPHCLISAGPHQPKKFIDINDVIFYLDQFNQEKNFSKFIGFNGGEIMTAYKEHSRDYIPTIIQECVNRNYDIDLRTNSLWTEDNSINSVIWESLNNINFSKYTKKISFSLSIDKFHNNESANCKLISKICNSDLIKHFLFTAYLIPDDPDKGENEETYNRLLSLLSLLSQQGVKFSKIKDKEIPDKFNMGIKLNKIPFLIETHNFGKWGRAREFNIGTQDSIEKHIKQQFDIIQKDTGTYSIDINNCVKSNKEHINMIFHNDGTTDFIVPVEKTTDGVPFHKNNECKPLSKLYPEMLENIQNRFNYIAGEHPQIHNIINLPQLVKTLKQPIK